MAGIDKFDWTNDLIIEFIKHYESHTVLWDPNHKQHKNRNSLTEAWEKIAKDIGNEVTVDALRRKKESLMSTYRTLIKRMRDSESTGATEIYEPTWFAFHAIDKFIKTKKNTSFCSEESQNYNEQFSQDESSQNELIVQEVLHKVEPIIEEEINEHPSLREINQDRKFVLPPVASKRRAREGLIQTESNVAKHFKNGSDALTSIATKSKTRHKETLQDASALYGQLLAAKLRRLSKRTRLVLQNQIDNLVFQAELNEIDSAIDCDTSCNHNSTCSLQNIHPVFLPVSNDIDCGTDSNNSSCSS